MFSVKSERLIQTWIHDDARICEVEMQAAKRNASGAHSSSHILSTSKQKQKAKEKAIVSGARRVFDPCFAGRPSA
jgi:hypothetical protein